MLKRRLGLEMRSHHGSSFLWVAFVHDRALVILIIVVSFAVEVRWTLVLVCAAILIDNVSHARITDRAVYATHKVVPLEDLSNIRGRIFV